MHLVFFAETPPRFRVKSGTVIRHFCACSRPLPRDQAMAAPGHAPISVVLEASGDAELTATHELLAAILRANAQVSDLIFSPGRPPQVEVNGKLIRRRSACTHRGSG